MWARATDLRNAALAAALLAAAAPAHPGGPALWRVRVGRAALESRIVIPLRDVARVPRDMLGQRLPIHFVVRRRGEALPARLVAVRLRSADDLEVELEHALGAPAGELELESTYFELTDAAHPTVVRLERDGRTESFLLDLEHPSRRIELGRAVSSQRWLLLSGGLLLVIAAHFSLSRYRRRKGAKARRK